MAVVDFTDTDKANLDKVFNAFNSGKRLDQLTQVLNIPNPEQWLVAAMNQASGEVASVAISNILLTNQDLNSYGVVFDKTTGNPLGQRVGNSSLAQQATIQSRIAGCLVDYNQSKSGVVNEYLTPNNWLAHDRSGAKGQVLPELPAHYRKFRETDTELEVRISDAPLLGYHYVPKMYLSAYEGYVNASGQLCSIVGDGILPTTNKTLSQFRDAARLGRDARWNQLVYNAYKSFFWLYFVEYANLNSQDTFTAAKDANGFAQGGLGMGVTTLSSDVWDTLNGQNPFIPCGYTDEFGNGSGVKDYTVSVGGTPYTVSVPRYRGIENPFGHIWKLLDGCKCIVQSDADGGLSQLYTCDDPEKFSDSGVEGYGLRGLSPRSSGYVKELILGENGEIAPSSVGAGSSTYFCDYSFSSIPDVGVSERGVLLGGHVVFGASAGFVCSNTHTNASDAYADVGSRLCFIPQS